jgi:vacuolar protein-sorting-associated protein 4
MEGALSSAIVEISPNVSWDDVSGLEFAKEGLKEAVVLPIKFPQLFDDVRQPWRGILMYGPPGTGKSFLAQACATECEGTFFSISSSDLVSKWMGESERLIKQLFTMARERKPSIIFIDEIDSLCGQRSEGENDSARRIKTEFLVQMQGVGNNNDGVLVLGATNVPWELDQAMRRRFQTRIMIDLPEAEARAGIMRKKGSKTKNTVADDDWIMLGQASEGYSGSDLANVVNEALMFPVRRCQSAKRFKPTPEGGLIPTFPSDPEGQDMTLMQVPPEKLVCPPVSTDDFMTALQRIKPSVNMDDVQQHHDWTAEFGQDS